MPSNVTTADEESFRGGRSCDRDALGALARPIFETTFEFCPPPFVDSSGVAGLSKERFSFTQHSEPSNMHLEGYEHCLYRQVEQLQDLRK